MHFTFHTYCRRGADIKNWSFSLWLLITQQPIYHLFSFYLSTVLTGFKCAGQFKTHSFFHCSCDFFWWMFKINMQVVDVHTHMKFVQDLRPSFVTWASSSILIQIKLTPVTQPSLVLMLHSTTIWLFAVSSIILFFWSLLN